MRKLQIRSREQILNQNDGNATIRTARGKAAIVLSLWKLILTPLVAVMFSMTFKIVELDNISAGFKAINVSNPSFVYFMYHIFASLFGYHFGWLACALCMQQIGYALPLTLATPIAIIMTYATGICETNTIPLPCRSEDQIYTLAAGSLLWLTQFLATTYYVWKSRGLIMAKAHDLLWIPSYNGVPCQSNTLKIYICIKLLKRDVKGVALGNLGQKLKSDSLSSESPIRWGVLAFLHCFSVLLAKRVDRSRYTIFFDLW